jgi:DNA primase
MSDTKQKKLKILVEILGNYSVSGNEYLFKCPFCNHHKKKLSVNLDKGIKCWICDVKTSNITRLVRRLGTFQNQQDWRELTGQVEVSEFENILLRHEVKAEEEQVISLPDEFVSLCNRNTSLTSVVARNYLANRGIDKSDILRWKLGYCPSGKYENRILAPSFNLNGDVNFFVGRTYTKHWKKYVNADESKDIIFNELYVDWDDDVVLCEGVFDAIKVPNSIPILGSTLREDSKLFAQIVRNDSAIYLALDPDADKKVEKLVESLLRFGIEVYKVHIAPYKDVGEMSKEEFMRRKEQAKLIKNSDSLLLDKIMSI